MTTALYLADATRRTFEARVVRTLDERIVLDRTCFYPTGGGQPHDTGTLRLREDQTGDRPSWTVSDVSKTDTIYHHLGGDPPAAGTSLVGELDWPRRHAHMRYHTAQHLLSAVLLDEFEAETVGNQLYHDHAHLDAAYDRFSDTDLDDIESRLNDHVDADLPVRWYDLDREEAESRLDTERTRLDLLPASITEVRIVEIGDADAPLDRTACAGTHVESTAEVGRVEVTGRETKGGETERIEFVLE